MMKNRLWGKRILLITFFVLICFLWLLWFFASSLLETTNYENRTMATMPTLKLQTYKTFAKDFEDYFNDNLPFRSQLITLNSTLELDLFGRASDDRVIIGKNHWLFYNDPADGSDLDSYLGDDLFTQPELEYFSQQCESVQQELAARGIEFVLFIAPNKERIYSENMPDCYGNPAENYRVLQVIQYLRQHTSVRVVYPYEEIMQKKAVLQENLYQKTDTHWNAIGGYVGTCALLKELGVDFPDITSNGITIRKGDQTAGDLAGMLNLTDCMRKYDFEYTVTGYDVHNMQNTAYDFNEVISYTAQGADPRRVYIYRDSFASAMAPYIGSQFDEVWMRKANSYSYEDFDAFAPDVFVYEVVERSLVLVPFFTLHTE